MVLKRYFIELFKLREYPIKILALYESSFNSIEDTFMELTDLKAIKPRQVKLLQDNGIDTVEALAMSMPADITGIDGMSDKAAKTLVWNARDELQMCTFKKVSDIHEDFQYIHTGSKNFDAILGGGLSTGRITEVYGAFKSGKTNLGHTLCVTTQLPKEKGGLGGTVLYIDTENTFSKAKIERIAKRFGLSMEQALKNIYHARAYSTDHQLQMIKAAEKAIKENNAKLIIVDSLTALMRAEYVGIGMLAPRQAILNKIIHDLSRVAETENIAVLVTNQVAVVMKGTFSANDAIGGNIVAHGCHYRVQFKTSGFQANASLERTATVVDAPDVPPNSATFYITEAGISDSETITYPDGTQTEPLPIPDDLSEPDEPLLISAANMELTEKMTIAKEPNDIELRDPLEMVEAALAEGESVTKSKRKKK
jgi:DNA repair protein RadA